MFNMKNKNNNSKNNNNLSMFNMKKKKKNNNNIMIIQSLVLMTFNLIYLILNSLHPLINLVYSWSSYFPGCFVSRPKFGLTFRLDGGLRVEVDCLEHLLMPIQGLHHLLCLPGQAYQVAKHH